MTTIKISNFSNAYNSKLLKISNSKKNFVIKLFLKKNNSNFIREIFFLSNLKKNKNIPKIISYDYQSKILVLSYHRGMKIKKKQSNYFDQILNFLKKIQSRKKSYILKNKLLAAREGCFCLQDHIKNTKQKINEIKKDKVLIKNLKFLYFINKIENIFKLKKKNILSKYEKKLLLKKFKFKNLVLSPSDFGFNNILLNSNNLIFFDFEYSGLDDPLKLCSDFIANPNTKISKYENETFLRKFSKTFKISNFKKRYYDYIDFYYIKWSIIILKYNLNIKNKSNSKIDHSIEKSKQYLINKKVWK